MFLIMLRNFYVIFIILQKGCPLNAAVANNLNRYLITRPWVSHENGHHQQENIIITTESEFLRRQKRQDNTDSTVSVESPASSDSTAATAATPPAFVANVGTPGFTCSVDLYQRINKNCCNLPSLVDDLTVSKCNRAFNFFEKQIPISQHSSMRNIPLRRYVLRKNLQVTNPNVTMLTTSQICLIQCVFKQLRWMNKFNVIDETYMKSYLGIQLPQVWGTRLENARLECASILTTNPEVYVANQLGMKCFLAPSKYIRCIKRHLLMNCENKMSEDKKCQLDNVKLSACDIFTL